MNDSGDKIICTCGRAYNAPPNTLYCECGQPLQPQQNQMQAGTGGGAPPPPGGPPPPPAGPTQPPPQPTPPTADNAPTAVKWGFYFAGLAVVPFCTIIAGIIALILGVVALAKGDKRGGKVILAAIVFSVIGIAIGWLLGNILPQYGY